MNARYGKFIGSSLLLVGLSLLLTGCPGDDSERVQRLNELRERVSGSFFLGSLCYIAAAFAGPSVAEASRKAIADKFKMSIEDQVTFAKSVYWTVVGIVVLVSFFDDHLSDVKPAVWILLGASAYPFFAHVIPSLYTQDKMRRKAALAQIKTFFMLIFIFDVILRFLSPEGFGNLQLK